MKEHARTRTAASRRGCVSCSARAQERHLGAVAASPCRPPPTRSAPIAGRLGRSPQLPPRLCGGHASKTEYGLQRAARDYRDTQRTASLNPDDLNYFPPRALNRRGIARWALPLPQPTRPAHRHAATPSSATPDTPRHRTLRRAALRLCALPAHPVPRPDVQVPDEPEGGAMPQSALRTEPGRSVPPEPGRPQRAGDSGRQKRPRGGCGVRAGGGWLVH